MGGRSSNANRNTNWFRSSVVNADVSKRIQTIMEDSAALQTEQTILVGERNGGRTKDTTLNTQDKKVLIDEVKTALVTSGYKKSDFSISITTPRLGENMFLNYLKIRPKRKDVNNGR